MNKAMRIGLCGFFLLVFVLCSVAFATSEIDFSSYSDDEFLTLFTRMQEELIARNIEKTATMPKGEYTVGIDIPAGKYVYANLRQDGWSAYVKVWTDSTKDNSVIYESVDKDGTLYLSLEDGYILNSDEEFTLTISMGARFQ